ncbi:hypothetical protein ACJX0J_042096 [Zea mays]
MNLLFLLSNIMRDSKTGNFISFGFVSYESFELSDQAIKPPAHDYNSPKIFDLFDVCKRGILITTKNMVENRNLEDSCNCQCQHYYMLCHDDTIEPYYAACYPHFLFWNVFIDEARFSGFCVGELIILGDFIGDIEYLAKKTQSLINHYHAICGKIMHCTGFELTFKEKIAMTYLHPVAANNITYMILQYALHFLGIDFSNLYD